ncbi:S-adenosylmethionine-homocysteine S-methyltransferase SAM4 [Kluyveromyces lactis]|uniref:homocysteine S-methyltransferase n=1 Tax=Kluyveromyces lactis (strain ATCC 8585 / CBS 2359 / DSM 70799 / NBRC 1267 / NRRL Y-1140 / WM37) TaxID=284590 RepID=Q6CSF1_KLULA|nr:uncharacterized protein KLLA0_D01551g [Kluyveromyces lactis]CAH00234.1 KLLA0D01551p [Kluyveromyces lactis]|eukprot:XP_453138.1 uncharacterized protein KLLA0_D01551g [Kluyveromyces lactis]
MRVPIKKYFEENPDVVLVMDGGQGTELENRGINVANPVWSTVPFINESFWSSDASKDRIIVKQMFEDFIEAGADILMTITYQTSFKSVSENTPIRTLEEYNGLLDRIVSFSRSCIGEDRYLIGCIGAWGAHVCSEFTGDYGPHPDQIDYFEYFRPQLGNFVQSKDIDIIGFETIPNIHELRAILSWDETVLSKPFYIGLSVHEYGVLRDGTSMQQIADLISSLGDKLNSNLMFIGINCCAFNQSHMILESLHNSCPNMPLIVYPNSGEIYDTVKKIWLKNENQLCTWDDVVKSYIENGARIIGGCCRTTVDDIKEVRLAVNKYAKQTTSSL